MLISNRAALGGCSRSLKENNMDDILEAYMIMTDEELFVQLTTEPNENLAELGDTYPVLVDRVQNIVDLKEPAIRALQATVRPYI